MGNFGCAREKKKKEKIKRMRRTNGGPLKRSMKWGVSKYNQRPGKTKGGKRYVTSQVYCTVLRPKKNA